MKKGQSEVSGIGMILIIIVGLLILIIVGLGVFSVISGRGIPFFESLPGFGNIPAQRQDIEILRYRIEAEQDNLQYYDGIKWVNFPSANENGERQLEFKERNVEHGELLKEFEAYYFDSERSANQIIKFPDGRAAAIEFYGSVDELNTRRIGMVDAKIDHIAKRNDEPPKNAGFGDWVTSWFSSYKAAYKRGDVIIWLVPANSDSIRDIYGSLVISNSEGVLLQKVKPNDDSNLQSKHVYDGSVRDVPGEGANAKLVRDASVKWRDSIVRGGENAKSFVVPCGGKSCPVRVCVDKIGGDLVFNLNKPVNSDEDCKNE